MGIEREKRGGGLVDVLRKELCSRMTLHSKLCLQGEGESGAGMEIATYLRKLLSDIGTRYKNGMWVASIDHRPKNVKCRYAVK